MKEFLLDFLLMFLGVASYTSLKKLHSLGQDVGEPVIDAIGIAGIFSTLMYISKKMSKEPK
jgi:hypothetical protein